MKNIIRIFLISTSIVCFLFNSPVNAQEKKWFVSLYTGKATDDTLNSLMRDTPDFIDYYVTSLAIGKDLWYYKDKVRIEFEIHFAEHWKHQNYEEYNAVFVFRWLKFPWDRFLDTSFAIGEGLSYATELSELEAYRHEDVTQFLNFLKFEFGFNLPKYPNWVLFFQIYHRSGMFETFDGVSGACNLMGGGIKYRF